MKRARFAEEGRLTDRVEERLLSSDVEGLV